MNSFRKISPGAMLTKAALGVAIVMFASGSVLAQKGGPGPGAGNGPNDPRPRQERDQDCTCKVTKMKTASGTVYVRDCYYTYSGAVHYCVPTND